MARKIIVGKRAAQSYVEIDYVFWLAVPANRQAFYANPTATSIVPGLSAGELTAIQSGAVKELSGRQSYPVGATMVAIGADLVAKYNAAQTALNAEITWQFYGTSWDGTTWTVAGN